MAEYQSNKIARTSAFPNEIWEREAGKNSVTAPDGTTSIPNFISPDYKPDGKTYRQLTPDGPLP